MFAQEEKKRVRLGLAGFGTVGGGVFDVLLRNGEILARRCGAEVSVKTVACRNLEKAREKAGTDVTVTDDWRQIVADPEIVSWDSVVRVAVANWQPEAKKAGLRLSWDKTDESQVMVNGAFAESVLDNLLRNALQYTDSGTIDVRLSADAVSVADTGRGIEDGEKESILHAFVRGETAPGEGYGWGLSLVRRICRKQGWRLEFRRNEPCGTVFTVRFGSENAF